MNKRKLVGVLIVIFGLIMVGGSMGSVPTYGVVAPISMGFIVVLGILVIFWDKVKAIMK
jgi:hypothetical protein